MRTTHGIPSCKGRGKAPLYERHRAIPLQPLTCFRQEDDGIAERKAQAQSRAVTRSHAQSQRGAAGELRASGWKAPDLHAGPGRAEDLDVDAGAVALAVEAWEAAQVLDQLGGDVVDQVGRHLEHEEDVLGAFLDEAQAGLLVGQVPGDDVARGLRVRALCDVVHLARLHLHRPATLTV